MCDLCCICYITVCSAIAPINVKWVAFPVTVNVRVTVVPAPPAVVSAEKVTSRTYVFLNILRVVSFRLSNASTKLSSEAKPTTPSFKSLKSEPNVCPSAVVLKPAIWVSTYALCDLYY